MHFYLFAFKTKVQFILSFRKPIHFYLSTPNDARHCWYCVCWSIYPAWNGNFSLSVNISADLAPMAVLFVYTIHPGGEIVADSVKFQIEQCFKNKVMFLLCLACPGGKEWAVFSLLTLFYVTTIIMMWKLHNKCWHNLITKRWKIIK